MPLSTDPLTTDALSIIVLHYNKDELLENQLTDLDYSFSSPQINTNLQTSPKDTLIIASPFATSGKYGSTRIYYNRLKLSDLTDLPMIARDANTTLADIINQINEYYGISLIAADYVQGAVITGPTVTIVSKPTSYLFTGQMTLTFTS